MIEHRNRQDRFHQDRGIVQEPRSVFGSLNFKTKNKKQKTKIKEFIINFWFLIDRIKIKIIEEMCFCSLLFLFFLWKSKSYLSIDFGCWLLSELLVWRQGVLSFSSLDPLRSVAVKNCRISPCGLLRTKGQGCQCKRYGGNPRRADSSCTGGWTKMKAL